MDTTLHPLGLTTEAHCATRALLVITPLALAGAALAGGSSENALLVVDPTSAEALYLANHYRAARDVPDANLSYFDPNPGSWSAFTGATRRAFLGDMENRGVADHVDYVVVMPGPSFYMTAPPGAVNDGCFPVNRFSTGSAFLLARETDLVDGGTSSQHGNGFWFPGFQARAFDAGTGWANGSPAGGGERYYIGAMLGYTGERGNTVEEVRAMVDRSVAVDGTFPTGTFYFMQTNDVARSSPRHGAYPNVSTAIQNLGRQAEHLFANLPTGRHDVLGVMTGLASPAIDGADMTVQPGAFCDHLTSFAATFDTSSQVKLSRWIAKGASGSHGTVEEPCNYSGKFPHARMHWFYRSGMSLGESWLRSLSFVPFQGLLVGDPLTRPWSAAPTVQVIGLPDAFGTGTLVLDPSATSPLAGVGIDAFELFVDGRSVAVNEPGRPFALDTRVLADGWHEARVLAYDDTAVRNVGRIVSWFGVANQGRSATLGAPVPASGDLGTRFDFSVDAAGATVAELVVLCGGRVVAATTTAPDTLSVYGQTLGAGRPRLVLEARFTDGTAARSLPVEPDIAFAGGGTAGQAPVAFSYTHALLDDVDAVVELPATFDDALDGATWTVLSPPAQATVVGGGSGPYRVLAPDPGAAGADALTFQVTTPSGTSGVATVTLEWTPRPACTTPINECVGAPNSVGPGATMSFAGEPRLAANDLTLFVAGCPPATIGIFFQGAGATQLPFGNGFLCVAPPVNRIGARLTDALGSADRVIDFTQPPFVSEATAGGTQRFQFWYRNPAAGGAGFNTSDALAVTYCP